jgi:hypothetical protein
MTVRVEGIRGFALLARKLKAVNRSELRKEFYAGINRTGRPLIEAVRESASTELPRSGGLAGRVAKSKFSTKRRFTGRGAGIRITGSSGYDLRSINQGRVRHKTFGHKPWKSQTVKPKFFDRPIEDRKDLARKELENVMSDIAKRLGG